MSESGIKGINAWIAKSENKKHNMLLKKIPSAALRFFMCFLISE